MSEGDPGFTEMFAPWLSDRIEFSFGPDPERFGTMLYCGPSALPTIERFSAKFPVAGHWWDTVRQFTTLTKPFGHFFKVDWHRGTWEKLTLYSRFKNGTTCVERLASACAEAGLRWPKACTEAIRDAVEGEPFLVGIRADVSGCLHLAVYHAPQPSFGPLVEKVIPAVTTASLGVEKVSEVASDLAMLHDGPLDRLYLELGVQSVQDRDELVCTFYPREVDASRARLFVETAGASEARHVSDLSDAVPGGRYLYAGVRYDRTGRTGWKLYTQLRPVRPWSELDLTRPPTPELIRTGYAAAPAGVAM